jgi:hypothetical protein
MSDKQKSISSSANPSENSKRQFVVTINRLEKVKLMIIPAVLGQAKRLYTQLAKILEN